MTVEVEVNDRLKVLLMAWQRRLPYGAWRPMPVVDDAIEIARLEDEVRRLRDGADVSPSGPPWVTVADDVETDDAELELFRLQWARFLLAYEWWRERHRQAFVVLGLEWPAPPGDGSSSYEKPWCWPWEPQPSMRHAQVPSSAGSTFRYVAADPLPVVYPADFDPETEEDVYGFAGRRSPGGLLLVPVDDLPLRPEVVAEPRPVPPVAEVGGRRRELPAPRRELEPPVDRRGGAVRFGGTDREVTPGLEGLSDFDAWVRRS